MDQVIRNMYMDGFMDMYHLLYVLPPCRMPDGRAARATTTTRGGQGAERQVDGRRSREDELTSDEGTRPDL